MKVDTPVPIPDAWVRRRGKYLFRRVKRDPIADEGVVTAFRDGQVTLRSNRREAGFTNAELEIGYQGIRVGDLVIHGMDGFAGAIGVSDSDGKASPVVHAYVGMAGNDARYYSYLLRDLALNGFIASLAKGIRERSTSFDSEMFKSLDLPLPSLAEQKAIADYLDRQTARIDAVISKKEQLIGLLNEYREALVPQFLAGEPVGLAKLDKTCHANHLEDEAPITAPSAVVLREGWSWARFGSALQHIDERTTDGAGTLLSVSKIHGVVPRNQITDKQPRAESLIGYKKCRAGDFIVNQMSAFDGLMGVAPCDGIVTYHYLVFRPIKEINLGFLHLTLTSETYKQDFSRRVRGLGDSSQGQVRTPHIRITDMLQTLIPLPTLVEQAEIYLTMDGLNKRYKELAIRIRAQVQLLRERRQALISSAVAGELKILEVAA